MHGLFCHQIGEVDAIVELEKAEAAHLFKTLRARVGEKVNLLDGKGKIATAQVIENQLLKIVDIKIFAKKKCEIALFVAAPRKQKLDQILKQVTELGVDYIAFTKCDYQVAMPEGNNSRWEAIIKESCKQSKNPFLPQILPVMSFNEAISYCRKNEFLGTFGDLNESRELVTSLKNAPKIGYFVGPEGGFSDKELELFQQIGFVGINLGPYILRLETAAVSAIPLLKYLVD